MSDFILFLETLPIVFYAFTGIFVLFFLLDRFFQKRLFNKSMSVQLEIKNKLLILCQEIRSMRTGEEFEELDDEEDEISSPELNNENKIYVGNVDYRAREEELAQHFLHLGDIENINIPLNRYNGRARGFGFITFKSAESARRAMELDGSEFRGRNIQVNFAK